MPNQKVTRRLAAIMVTDIVGYSRAVEADETGMLARVKSDRTELIDPCIEAHGGHIVKSLGDGLLIEYPSAVEALACAVDIQTAVARRNGESPAGQRIEYRIGVNLGDVVVEDGDILGHGVNVASRLQALAEPGGIWISRAVHDQVKGHFDRPLEYAGEQKFKNIEEPVQAFRVGKKHDGGPHLATATESLRGTGSTRRHPAIAFSALAVAGLIALGLGLGFYGVPLVEQPADQSIGSAAPLLPDKPSIAVLPFTNMSDDPEQAYFSDGMSEDLITDLSKVSGLFVVSRNSSFSYRGRSVDVRRIAGELGVRYVLEGSVRRAGEQVRINAQLIDASSGGHVWAERYDGNLADVFELQDKVTRKIVSVLAVQLTVGEQEHIAHKETANSEAYDQFLKGWEQYQKQTPDSVRQAVAYFEKAVELDPNYARAYAALSATYWQVWRRGWHAKFGMTLHLPQFRAEEYLEKSMHDPTSLALQTATSMLAQQGRHDDAIAEGERAIALDPNDADSYVALAGACSLAGQFERAQQLIERAMRLNPHYPPSYLYELGLARFGLEQYAEAADALEKAMALNPDDRWSSRLLLAAYGHLDRREDAAKIFQDAEANWRGFDPLSVRGVAFWYPFKKPEDAERLAEGLRLANVPD